VLQWGIIKMFLWNSFWF